MMARHGQVGRGPAAGLVASVSAAHVSWRRGRPVEMPGILGGDVSSLRNGDTQDPTSVERHMSTNRCGGKPTLKRNSQQCG